MNNHRNADIAKEARRLQRDGMSAASAAAYMGMTVERLAEIGGVMETDLCHNCGETTSDGHQFKGQCLRVTADSLPAMERTKRGDW